MASEENCIEPWNFSWVVQGVLSACSWPRTDKEINWLRKQGVRSIISLSEERRPPPLATELGMDCHVIAVVEFEPPTMEQIVEFNEICEKMSKENKPVCVHCRMGLGRTGVMLASYLVKNYQQSAQQAIKNIRLMRPWSVETRSQEKSVEDYEKFIR